MPSTTGRSHGWNRALGNRTRENSYSLGGDPTRQPWDQQDCYWPFGYTGKKTGAVGLCMFPPGYDASWDERKSEIS